MTIPIDLTPAMTEQARVAIMLAKLSETTGYLLLPTFDDVADDTHPWTPNRPVSVTRGWMRGMYEKWCRARQRWPVIVRAGVLTGAPVAGLPITKRCHFVAFETPALAKWNTINAALHLLAGGAPRRGESRWQRKHANRDFTCEMVSNRYEFHATSRDMCDAALAILDMPANRAFLTRGTTLGRRIKS